MSNRMINMAWQCPAELNQGELLVLVKLADNANDDGTGCFPSQSTISEAVRMKRESVSRICRRLREKGLIEWQHRPGRSNRYQLLLTCDRKSQVEESTGPESTTAGCDRGSQGGVIEDHRGCDPGVTPPVTRGSHITQREPSPNQESDAGGNADGVTHVGQPRVPYQKIVELFHEILPEMRAVAKLTSARRTHVRQRWQNELKSLDRWRAYFESVRESDFLMGRKPPGPGRSKPWQADFDFLITERAVVRHAEGEYVD